MTKENLGYLYARVKKPSLSKEEALLVRRTHFFKTLDLAIGEAIDALHDKTYAKALGGSRKNWTGEDATKVIDAVVAYLEKL